MATTNAPISPSDFKPIPGVQIVGCGMSIVREREKNKEDKRERKEGVFLAHISLHCTPPEWAIRLLLFVLVVCVL